MGCPHSPDIPCGGTHVPSSSNDHLLGQPFVSSFSVGASATPLTIRHGHRTAHASAKAAFKFGVH